jgi:hypothetical protein
MTIKVMTTAQRAMLLSAARDIHRLACEQYIEDWKPNLDPHEAVVGPGVFIVQGFDDAAAKIEGSWAPNEVAEMMLSSPTSKQAMTSAFRQFFDRGLAYAFIVVCEAQLSMSTSPEHAAKISREGIIGSEGAQDCITVQIHSPHHTTLLIQGFKDGQRDGEVKEIGEDGESSATGRMSMTEEHNA